MGIRIIGDCHDNYEDFSKIVENTNWPVVQLGDFGEYKETYDSLNSFSPEKVRILLGNHENYDIVNNYPHFLGDYGSIEHGGINFFYMRGSVSIDAATRVQSYLLTGRKQWWYEEELSEPELEDAINTYISMKPDVVLTHDCPSSIRKHIPKSDSILKAFGLPKTYTCKTQQALDVMFKYHKPKLHFFGHWHLNWNKKIEGTHFFCVNSLDFLDLDDKMNVSPGRRNKTAGY